MKTRYVKARVSKKPSLDARPAKGPPTGKEPPPQADQPEKPLTGEKPLKKRLFQKRSPKASSKAPREKSRFRLFKGCSPKTKPSKGPSSKKQILKPILIGIPSMVLILGISLTAFNALNKRAYTPSPYTPPVMEEETQPDTVMVELPAVIEEPPQKTQISEEKEAPADSGPSVEKLDRASLQEELDLLSENRPTLLIDCTFCDGSGNSSTPCERCGGHGILFTGVTMFQTFIDCPNCGGDKFEPCDHCTFGLMNNPDFETEIKAWHDRRHELWRGLGYSEAEIAAMEEQEAKNALDNREDFMQEIPSFPEKDSDISDEGTEICRVCNTTGKCPTCNGARRYINPYTGEFLDCSTCKNTGGNCWRCGGTGRL